MIRVKDLPRLRRELLDKEKTHPLDDDPQVQHAFIKALTSASLWWVSPTMTQLAQAAADTLPDWTPMIARPDTSGLLVWAGPGLTVESPDQTGQVQAFFWQMASTRIRITTHTTTGRHLEEFATFDFNAETPFSIAKQFTDPTLTPLIQLIGATWLLMQQPTVSDRKPINHSGRHGGRPADPAKPQHKTVQVIDLRRLSDRADEKDPDADPDGRTYHHRWMVRGHWRQQACGPKRAHRKPVFVPPHIKGPDGAPLLAERVHVWRR